MGLQKGEQGYAFRWLTPVFSLVAALSLLTNAVVLTFAKSLTSGFGMMDIFGYFDFIQSVDTAIKLYIAFGWMLAILMLVTAILGFVMNKKGSYLLAIISGALNGLVALIKFCVLIYIYKNAFFIGNAVMLLAVYMFVIAAFSICVCVFGAVATSKCDYEKTVSERNSMGENLTYVGFENGRDPYMSGYHNPNPAVPDPYAPPEPPVVPTPEPKKPPIYVPSGPVGHIVGVRGMYNGVSFDISDNEAIVIGRDPRVAQIVIGEGAQNVSRQHCIVTYSVRDNSFNIKDTSKNGTFSVANRTKLPHGVFTKVPSGTEIYLGDKSNTFRLS